MNPIEHSGSQSTNAGGREMLPLSLLNDFLFCERRAALKVVEGWRSANQHTNRGDIVHEHADLPGYESQISNLNSQIIVWRALPVWSERLGLNGKCDIAEAGLGSNLRCEVSNWKPGNKDLKSEISDLKSSGIAALKPVEFKLGKRRQWDNDDVQLCAQALCLEEMFGIAIPLGAVFHADSKRRREVEFTPELRLLTETTVASLHALLRGSEVSNSRFEIPRLPPAVWKPACEECSLFEICLPKATEKNARAASLARKLFEI